MSCSIITIDETTPRIIRIGFLIKLTFTNPNNKMITNRNKILSIICIASPQRFYLHKNYNIIQNLKLKKALIELLSVYSISSKKQCPPL